MPTTDAATTLLIEVMDTTRRVTRTPCSPGSSVDSGEKDGSSLLEEPGRCLEEKGGILHVFDHLARHHRVVEVAFCACAAFRASAGL